MAEYLHQDTAAKRYLHLSLSCTSRLYLNVHVTQLNVSAFAATQVNERARVCLCTYG